MNRKHASVCLDCSLLCDPAWEICCGAAYFSTWCLFLSLSFSFAICILFHSVKVNFCITSCLSIMNCRITVPAFHEFCSLGSFTWVLFWAFPYPSVTTLYSFRWGNKHVGAWTCPTDTVVALLFVTVIIDTADFTDRALCSQRTLKICILSN